MLPCHDERSPLARRWDHTGCVQNACAFAESGSSTLMPRLSLAAQSVYRAAHVSGDQSFGNVLSPERRDVLGRLRQGGFEVLWRNEGTAQSVGAHL